ncbi:MAG TPA: FAD-dependent oxidoreductase, partial [Candidatus Babeliales bacterium]|nr:FAD-dependent oxidoreductase [Candidatus Babeliales bacterium]
MLNVDQNLNPVNHTSSQSHQYDVIVVGGGHAGAEAAYAAATLGAKTLLVTLDLNKISLMPCNPSIGGVGKGQIVFEISALGGLMPQLCSETYLQARMLNTRKGPAVHGLRLQIDKTAYSKLSRERLAQLPNLTLLAGCVDGLLFTPDFTPTNSLATGSASTTLS